MQENDLIYELAEVFFNTDNLKNELSDSFGLVVNDLRKKYMGKINKVIETQKVHAAENMSKEIKLLNAIKPFAKSELNTQLDNIIELMTNIHTVKNIHSQIMNVKADTAEVRIANVIDINRNQFDSSIKADGVYDFDNENAARNGNPNLLYILILLIFINSI